MHKLIQLLTVAMLFNYKCLLCLQHFFSYMNLVFVSFIFQPSLTIQTQHLVAPFYSAYNSLLLSPFIMPACNMWGPGVIQERPKRLDEVQSALLVALS